MNPKFSIGDKVINQWINTELVQTVIGSRLIENSGSEKYFEYRVTGYHDWVPETVLIPASEWS